MNRLVLVLIFLLLLSACGSADDYFDDLEGIEEIDSIRVVPPSTNDSTGMIPIDTLVINNDSIINEYDSIYSDSLRIHVKPEIEYTKLFVLSSSSRNSFQGFAIYDSFLFSCHHSNDIIDVFDLSTLKKVASIQLEPEAIVHSNNVNFGSEFYTKDDRFPLLYIQQRGYACKLNAYRILCSGDSIVGTEKVQTISFSSCSFCINTIDIGNNYLYAIYGYNKKSYISAFRMPSVKEGDVIIHPRSAYKTFYTPYNKVGQDTAFEDKYLYVLCGYSREGELWRIDMENNTARVIDFTKYGLNKEPEGIDVYKGNVMVSFIDGLLYRISILN